MQAYHQRDVKTIFEQNKWNSFYYLICFWFNVVKSIVVKVKTYSTFVEKHHLEIVNVVIKKYLLLINVSFYIRCNRYIVIGVVIMYFLSNIFFLILSVGIGIYKIKLKDVLINYCIYLLLICFRRQNKINSGVKKWKKRYPW